MGTETTLSASAADDQVPERSLLRAALRILV